MKKIVFLQVLFLACCFVVNLSGCRKSSVSVESSKSTDNQVDNKDAGNWTLPVLLNAKSNGLGDTVELKQLVKDPKIKLVMVTYWATWGEPEKDLLTYLNDIFLKYKAKGLTVLAISIDQNEELKPKIINSILGMKWKKNGNGHKAGELAKIAYPILWDIKNIYRDIYGIGAIPVTFLVDKNNKIVYSYSSFSEELIEDLKEKIGELLP